MAAECVYCKRCRFVNIKYAVDQAKLIASADRADIQQRSFTTCGLCGDLQPRLFCLRAEFAAKIPAGFFLAIVGECFADIFANYVDRTTMQCAVDDDLDTFQNTVVERSGPALQTQFAG